MEEPSSSVLIVDDVAANIQLLSHALSDEHKIYFATNGEKAIELCRAKQPDLVLLDLVMPGLDGYEVCQRLKADCATRDIPVIFITARNETEAEARGLEVGAIDFVTKPFSPPIIRARVRNHVRLKRQSDLLRRLSSIDGLTGIANRRQFDEMLARAWRRSARAAQPVSLLIIDIDHFKQYNDHYGHQAGDDCLRQVAQALASQVARPDDLVARYGGEEFVCLLPATDLHGAVEVADKMAAAVAAMALPHAASPVVDQVTLSIGVATQDPAQVAAERLVADADSRLYQAKAAGRNRCCAAFEPAAG